MDLEYSRTSWSLGSCMNKEIGDTNILIGLSNTRRFLEACKEAGYTRIAIRVSTKDIPYSVDFCFGPQGSVFAWPNCNKGFWPAIWNIAQSFGCKSCGNGQQYQINDLNVIDGYYFLKDGHWIKHDVNKT